MIATEHLGSRWRFLPFCAARDEVVNSTPSVQTARTGLVWGRPVGCTVVNQLEVDDGR